MKNLTDLNLKSIIVSTTDATNGRCCKEIRTSFRELLPAKERAELIRLRQRRRLTLCLELLEKQGLTGDWAIFVLTLAGLGGAE